MRDRRYGTAWCTRWLASCRWNSLHVATGDGRAEFIQRFVWYISRWRFTNHSDSEPRSLWTGAALTSVWNRSMSVRHAPKCYEIIRAVIESLTGVCCRRQHLIGYGAVSLTDGDVFHHLMLLLLQPLSLILYIGHVKKLVDWPSTGELLHTWYIGEGNWSHGGGDPVWANDTPPTSSLCTKCPPSASVPVSTWLYGTALDKCGT